MSLVLNDRRVTWWHAVNQWERGDIRGVVDFVRKNGIRTDREREDLVRMLTTKPDPRRRIKKATENMLRDLDFQLAVRDAMALLEAGPYPLDRVYDAVAQRHGVGAEYIKKLHQRYRRKG